MRRLRVAHIITRLCRGGAQENTFHTVRLSNPEQFEPHLISGPPEGAEGSLEPVVQAAGLSIIRVPTLRRAVNPAADWRALRRLTGLLREGRYDIVHTHTSKAGYIGRWAARRAGVPIVVHTPHGHIFHGYFPRPTTWLFTQLERQAARWTDRLIALTPRGIEEHLAHGIGRPEQWVSIFSGIDLAPFKQARARRDTVRRALGVSDEETLVGGVGRLEPVKGFAYFVDAAHRVAEQEPRARFIVAGEGSQERVLRDAAGPLGSRFTFLGFREDVPDLMAAMDVFVLPSLNEGMGRVLLECGAAGTPAAASAVGGVPGLVKDGDTGLLVPPGDAEALAGAVCRLIQAPQLRREMAARAHRHVVPAYGIERMVRMIENLYGELAEQYGLEG